MKKINYDLNQLRSNFLDDQLVEINRVIVAVQHLTGLNTLTRSSFEIANILISTHVDTDTVVAALLADPFLNKKEGVSIQLDEFGQSVSMLVHDVNSLNQLQVYSTDMSQQPKQAETLRRMLLSSIQDVRTVLIKLAYRIYRLRNLTAEEKNIRHFIAQETLDIYAPIANRLGVSQIKWELEDLAFRYLQPEVYVKLVKSLEVTRHQREEIIDQFRLTLQQILDKENIDANIKGRPKHIYSIWKKMQRKNMSVDELYDLLAVRVLVSELSECYAVLGIVHGEWQYIPKEFDDYISNAKSNGYQSLHTVIVDPAGHRIEIQIRTLAMDEFAEMGVAAHWRYKEGSKQNAATEKSIASLRQLLVQKENDQELVESFKAELFYDRVYVLSPAGKLVDLIKGSTPLDFAYAIHTEIGHRCRGAKVNGRIVPLTYQLNSGEQVEILTAKEGEPNPHWIDLNLGYLKNPRTINKIRRWFKQQDDDKNIASGKLQLENAAKIFASEQINLNKIVEYFNKADSDQLFLALGRGEITAHQLENVFKKPEPYKSKSKKTIKKIRNDEILIDGMKNLASSIAKCCKPVTGDEIIGYISHYKGITIHRIDCENIKHLNLKQKTQLIAVQWNVGANDAT